MIIQKHEDKAKESGEENEKGVLLMKHARGSLDYSVDER
jgi:hypothetical protein